MVVGDSGATRVMAQSLMMLICVPTNRSTVPAEPALRCFAAVATFNCYTGLLTTVRES